MTLTSGESRDQINDGVLIHNTGGAIELFGSITETGSLDLAVRRISTDTPVVGDFTASQTTRVG